MGIWDMGKHERSEREFAFIYSNISFLVYTIKDKYRYTSYDSQFWSVSMLRIAEGAF